ncbi:hypothetical protein [Algoriphagus boritolerans]|uniref:hypothetical protein n=1 Tax=Algoriphagus boritolerans TaxID=308111 RepID=UPI002FCE2ACE
MSESDRVLFEKLLKDNPEYQVQFHAFQQNSKEISKAKSRRTTFKTWSISVAIAVVIVAVGYFLARTLSMPPGEKLFLSFYEPREVLNSETQTVNNELSLALASYENEEYTKAEALFFKTGIGKWIRHYPIVHGTKSTCNRPSGKSNSYPKPDFRGE